MTVAAPSPQLSALADLGARVTSALSALRVMYLEKRDHIETCRGQKNGLYQRPEHWFHSQESRLADIEFAGAEFAFIVAHWDSYAAWRASVGGKAA